MSKLLPNTVRAKLLALVTSVIIIMMGVFVAYMYKTGLSNFYMEREKRLQARYEQVVQTIEDKSWAAYSLAEWVAHEPQIKKLFAQRNRQDLLERTLPIYEQIKDKVNVNKFQFHIPPATSFLRLHKIKKFGDDLTNIRPTIVQTNKSQKPSIGLDKGRFGFGIRGVVPVFEKNKHVGSVEFGMSVNKELLMPLKKRGKFDIGIIIPDNQEFTVQASTRDMPASFMHQKDLQTVMSKAEMVFRKVKLQNKDLLVLNAPLKDFAGNTLGIVLLPDDVSQKLAALRYSTMISIAWAVLATIIIIVLLYYILNRLVNKPLKNVEKMATLVIQKNDLTQRVVLKNSQDEIGAIGNSFNLLLDNFQNVVQGIASNVDYLAGSSADLTQLSRNMASNAQDNSARSETVASAAEQMSSNIGSVAAAMEQTSTNVSTVASGAEEMSTSIRDISAQSEQAKEITESAVSQARDVATKVDKLGNAAQDIGKITETISAISAQTNLLALNATIEAARAGEAGKGFAVVANEIKELARQTSEATEDIASRLQAIQDITGNTVQDIEKITEVVGNVDEFVSAIAASMEQQTATTKEIAENVGQASQGINEVNANLNQSSQGVSEISSDIGEVSKSAQSMSDSGEHLQENAVSLSKLAATLMGLVSKYQASKEDNKQSDCELLEKCGFFKKYRDKDKNITNGFMRLYCQGPKKEECERKKYRKKYGKAPDDDMMPDGNMMEQGAKSLKDE